MTSIIVLSLVLNAIVLVFVIYIYYRIESLAHEYKTKVGNDLMTAISPYIHGGIVPNASSRYNKDEKESSFFMVYVEGEHAPAYKHDSLSSAEKEAKRLAETSNQKAYVLRSMKSFEVNKFTVRDCQPTLKGLF